MNDLLIQLLIFLRENNYQYIKFLNGIAYIGAGGCEMETIEFMPGSFTRQKLEYFEDYAEKYGNFRVSIEKYD